MISQEIRKAGMGWALLLAIALPVLALADEGQDAVRVGRVSRRTLDKVDFGIGHFSYNGTVYPIGNVPNGIPVLDGTGRVPLAALPPFASSPVVSVAGRAGVVTLTTSDVSEASRLYFTNPRAIAAPLTGFSAGAGVVSATDSVLSALQKHDAAIAANTSSISSHIANTSNPHSVTKSQVGLGNVDNTSDAAKPISTAQAAVNATTQPLNANLTGVSTKTTTVYADQYAVGGNAGAKLLAAQAALPAGGGIVDATSLVGAQTINSSGFLLGRANGDPITFIFGPATYSVSTATTIIQHYDNVHFIFNDTTFKAAAVGASFSSPGGMFSSVFLATTGSITAGSNTLTIPNNANAAYFQPGKAVAIRGMAGANSNQRTTISNGGSSITSGATTIPLASTTSASIDDGGVHYFQIDSEIVTGTLSGSTLTGVSRGVFGTTPASHSDGANVDYLFYQVTTVAAVSGTTITLDDAATATVTNAPVTIGSTGDKFDGTGTLDGQRNTSLTPSGSNPTGIYLTLATHCSVGDGIRIINFAHSGVTLDGSWYNTIKGQFQSIGRPSVPIGFGVIAFRQSSHNYINPSLIADIGSDGITMDDRTTHVQGIEAWDGPSDWNTVVAPAITNVSGAAVSINGSNNNVISAGAISGVSSASGVIINSFQWTTQPQAIGNVVRVGSISGVGTGVQVANGAGNDVTVGSTSASISVAANNNIRVNGKNLLPAGTEALPSVTSSADTATGIWWNGTSTLDFSTAGTKRLEISPLGRVGIGTGASVPATTLDVHTNGAAVAIGDNSNTSVSIGVAASRGMVGYDGANAVFQSGSGKGLKLEVNSATFGSGTVGLSLDSSGNVSLLNALSVTSGGNGLSTATLGDIRYGSATNTLAALAGNTSTTPKYLRQVGTGTISAVPTWAQIPFSELSGSATISQLPTGTTSSTVATGDTGVTSLALNTANLLYGTPITFTNTSGAWSGTMTVNSQSAWTILGNGTSGSAAPTFETATGTSSPVRSTSPVITTPTISTLGSAAGVTLNLNGTISAAGASTIAGTNVALTASAAVAGTTNAGAAAGGNVAITAGNAARLSSGNANGGDINIVPGNGIGTGTTGKTTISATVTQDGSTGVYGQLELIDTATPAMRLSLGYNDSSGNGWGFIQALKNASAYTPLRLQPNGSYVALGTTATGAAGDLVLGGKVIVASTVTTAGTTGAQTINKARGTVRFAAGASTLVVTNSLVASTSKLIAGPIGAFDTTATKFACTAGSGSFTITANAAATAETEVIFDLLIP